MANKDKSSVSLCEVERKKEAKVDSVESCGIFACIYRYASFRWFLINFGFMQSTPGCYRKKVLPLSVLALCPDPKRFQLTMLVNLLWL